MSFRKLSLFIFLQYRPKVHRSISNVAFKLCTKIKLDQLKGKSKSSQEWLIRQSRDPYVEKAKMLNYRCRSAFKLLEIDDKYKILKRGDLVVDCGGAPGSWAQVAAKRVNADKSVTKSAFCVGEVFSIDLLQIHPIEGVTLLDGMDFTAQSTQTKLITLLNNRPVNCILSDMAPNATGVKTLDQENITNLCYSVLRFACLLSAEGGHVLMKIWNNGDVPKLLKIIEKFYGNVRRIKPKSSRNDSAEEFLLGRNFKGVEKT